MVSKNQSPQLFDIRPTKKDGSLDVKKIQRVKKVLDLRGEITPREQYQKQKAEEKKQLGRKKLDNIIEKNEAENFFIQRISKHPIHLQQDADRKDSAPQENSSKKNQAIEKYFQEEYTQKDIIQKSSQDYLENSPARIASLFRPARNAIVTGGQSDTGRHLPSRTKYKTSFYKKEDESAAEGNQRKDKKEIFAFQNIFHFNLINGWKTSIFLFLIISSFLFASVQGMSFLQKGIQVQGKVLGASVVAYKHLELAQSAALNSQYAKSNLEFQSAYQNFLNAENQFSKIGESFIKIAKYLPIDSPVSNGDYLLNAGKNLSLAGQYLNKGMTDISKINPIKKNGISKDRLPPTEILEQTAKNFLWAKFYFKKTQNDLSKVNISSIPENFQNSLANFQNKLPIIIKSLDSFNESAPIISEILGEYYSKKYLLVFQNNHEMRASGGFIGTYGIIDINEGIIENIFIDGIYNPDGQLQEKIIPPRPIQKISAAWSMHDSNWFADFPSSAKKIAWFYEKTGGPTVDGVISITPNVIEDLLKITGPIEMPEYEMVIDENNFRGLTQYEVEVDYDKDLNQPKKILADMTPKLMERIFNTGDSNEIKWLDLLNILSKNLLEKHILIYSFDPKTESFISENGWSGEILETDKDYLNVINSNINGYKTDGMIEQKIQHRAEIQSDGSIIDSLTIIRTHHGGDTPYDWYNKVNANYLRVYVPKGSRLLEAQGHTVEKYFLPLDYSYFSKDPDIEEIEKTLCEDEATGTHIFEESGKTVFGNWVYVSPGETVIVTYKYKLPFRFDFSKNFESYGLLAQKQSGSYDVDFRSSFNIPQGWETIRQVSENIFCESGICQMSKILDTDQFYGAVFKRIEE